MRKLAATASLAAMILGVSVLPAGAQSDEAPTAYLSSACTTGPYRVPGTLLINAGSAGVEVVAGDVSLSLGAFEQRTVDVAADVGVADVTLNGGSDGVFAANEPACPPPDFLPLLANIFRVEFLSGCAASDPQVPAQFSVELSVPDSFELVFTRPITADLLVDDVLRTFEVSDGSVVELSADAGPPVVTFAGGAVFVAVEERSCDDPPINDAPSSTDDAPSSSDDAPSNDAKPPSSGEAVPVGTPLAPSFTG